MSISLLCAKLAMDSAGEGIIIVDLGQKTQPIIYANTGFVTLTGYSLDEILGQNCRFLQGKDTSQQTVKAVHAAIGNRSRHSVELLNYKKNGALFWNRLTLAPFHENGVDYMVGVQMDITKERLAILALSNLVQKTMEIP